MIFFDYVYYRMCNYYKRKDSIKEDYKGEGAIVACGFIGFNVMFIILLIEQFYFKFTSNKYEALLYCLPFALLMGLRLWKFTSYKEIEEKIRGMSNLKTTILDILVILYVIISLPFAIGIAIYIGGINNPPPFWESWFR